MLKREKLFFGRGKIRFPKKKETAYGFEELLRRHDKRIMYRYDLAETDMEIYIKEQVKNILFVKSGYQPNA